MPLKKISRKEVDLTKLKVLLVEDQPDNRALTRNMLMEMGITQIFEASNGEEGLSFADMAFDMINFIVCDWNMPQVEGIDVLKKVREMDPHIPFLMVTGRGDLSSVNKAINEGVTGYIKKPFSPYELEAKLRIIMYRRMVDAQKNAFI